MVAAEEWLRMAAAAALILLRCTAVMTTCTLQHFPCASLSSSNQQSLVAAFS